MKNILIVLIVLIQYGYANTTYYYQNKQQVILTPSDSISRSVSPMDYYTNEKGLLLGVSDKLLLKLSNSEDLEKILNKYQLTLLKTLGETLYLLQTSNKNLTINISNQLSKINEVDYAHPDFLRKRMRR